MKEDNYINAPQLTTPSGSSLDNSNSENATLCIAPVEINNRSIFKGKYFLIVDDNKVNQKVIRSVLQKAGGRIDIANNGLEAISFLKTETHYNLILMDLQMPEMDGYAATKYIRNVISLTIPIIAMTANALNSEKEKCRAIGMNDYISKPFDLVNLCNRINALLNSSVQLIADEVEQKTDREKLYDLSMLEEMDDNKYLVDILTLFFDNTPAELNDLQIACKDNLFDKAYIIAHRLKSSVGLLKATAMLDILNEMEKMAEAKKSSALTKLIAKANEEYKKISIPLKKHLENMQAASCLNM